MKLATTMQLALGLMASGAFASAAEFRLASWNVESGGTQRTMIGRQLRDFAGVRLWALSEVHPANAEFYIRSTGSGEPGSFFGLIGATGGADRLVIAYDQEFFEWVEGFELSDLALGGGRAPLIAHLRIIEDGTDFLFVANHLYRGNAAKRLQQAIGLRHWAQTQTAPIVTAGDFNFDYELPDGPGNDAFVEFGLARVFQWATPQELTATNWSDANGDGRNDFDHVLDFVWTAGLAQQWRIRSEIVVKEGDFPDDQRTSDHRPLVAEVDTRPAVDATAAPASRRAQLKIAMSRTIADALSTSSRRVEDESPAAPLSAPPRLATSAAPQDFGRFEGEVIARWLPDGREMRLEQEFAFVDAAGRRWLAPRGSVVDGASIPRPLWSLIGGPFSGTFRNASVVHDVACQDRSSAWQDVHRMFYEACRCGGVSAPKAKVMYWAVYHFGPRWGWGPVAAASSPASPLTEAQLDAVRAYVDLRHPSLNELESLQPPSTARSGP